VTGRPVRLESNFVNGLKSLPVRLSPRRRARRRGPAVPGEPARAA
jgi:hypothetical protein